MHISQKALPLHIRLTNKNSPFCGVPEIFFIVEGLLKVI